MATSAASALSAALLKAARLPPSNRHRGRRARPRSPRRHARSRSRTASQRSSAGTRLHQDARTAGLVERAQVRVEIVRVGLQPRAGIDPGDGLIGAAAAGAAPAPRCAGRPPTAPAASSSISSPGTICQRRRPARSARADLPGTRGACAEGSREHLAHHAPQLREADRSRGAAAARCPRDRRRWSTRARACIPRRRE